MSVVVYSQIEYVGIVQNQDTVTTSFYDYGSIQVPEIREKFLVLADQWWWESTRKIPINLFLRSEWGEFKQYLKVFISRELKIIHGPTVSLLELAKKRSKRRSITLLKKPQ